MKNKVWLHLQNLLVTIITAFIATNSESRFYLILNYFDLKNESLRKVVLGAMITFLIGIFSTLISTLLRWFMLSLSKIEIEISIKQSNRKKTNLCFEPNNKNEYEEEIVNLEVRMNTKGKLSNFIAKWLDINVEIFFNPNIIDISLVKQWDQASLNGFVISERSVKIYILKNMRIQGATFNSTEHVMSEEIQMKPIRVKKQETILDYCPVFGNGNFFLNKIATHFLKIKSKQFKIKCEEVK